MTTDVVSGRRTVSPREFLMRELPNAEKFADLKGQCYVEVHRDKISGNYYFCPDLWGGSVHNASIFGWHSMFDAEQVKSEQYGLPMGLSNKTLVAKGSLRVDGPAGGLVFTVRNMRGDNGKLGLTDRQLLREVVRSANRMDCSVLMWGYFREALKLSRSSPNVKGELKTFDRPNYPYGIFNGMLVDLHYYEQINDVVNSTVFINLSAVQAYSKNHGDAKSFLHMSGCREVENVCEVENIDTSGFYITTMPDGRSLNGLGRHTIDIENKIVQVELIVNQPEDEFVTEVGNFLIAAYLHVISQSWQYGEKSNYLVKVVRMYLVNGRFQSTKITDARGATLL